MIIPFWLWRYLPHWTHICPKCRKEVKANSHECPHCGEKYPLTVRVPFELLKKLDTLEGKKRLEAYVHKHVFPRIGEFERNYLTQYFTVLFADGQVGSTMETAGDFSAWTGGDNSTGETRTVVTTDPHHGSNHASFYCNGSSTNEYAKEWKDITATANLNVHLAVKFITALPASGKSFQILNFRNIAADETIAQIGVINTGAASYWYLTYMSGADQLTDISATAVSLNAYYEIELQSKVHASAGEVRVFLAGSEIADLTHTGLDTNEWGNHDRFMIGEMWSDGQTAHTVRIDCVTAADVLIGPESTNVSVSDSGVGSDVAGMNAALPLTEAGSGVDVVPNITHPIADAGSGSDALGMTATLPLADVCAGVESLDLQATLALSDSGSGLDEILLQATLMLIDAGVGIDVIETFILGLTVNVDDLGVGSDSLALLAALSLGDLGGGVDAVDMQAQLLLNDAGAGADTVTANVTLTLVDAGTGEEIASIIISGVTINVSDLGSALDSAGIQGIITLGDSGVGVETGLTVTVNISDSGLGSELAALLASLSVTDSGVGVDAATLNALLSLVDAGLGVDSVLAGFLRKALRISMASNRQVISVQNNPLKIQEYKIKIKIESEKT
jgi:hypothetical protein